MNRKAKAKGGGGGGGATHHVAANGGMVGLRTPATSCQFSKNPFWYTSATVVILVNHRTDVRNPRIKSAWIKKTTSSLI